MTQASDSTHPANNPSPDETTGGESKDSDSAGGAAPTQGFGTVAKRITGWTSNLIASAIIIIVAMVFTFELTKPWRNKTTVPGPVVTTPVNDADMLVDVPSRPTELVFGAGEFSMQRLTVEGDRDQALAKLIQLTRTGLQTASLPSGSVKQSEQQLLRRVARRKPLVKLDVDREIHQFQGDVPMVIGTMNAEHSTRTTEQKDVDVDADVDLDGRRVVIWGTASPSGPRSWTLFSYRPGGERLAIGPESVSDVRLPRPPGASHLMSLRTGKMTTMAFEGSDSPEQWTEYFDAWAVENDWVPASWHVASDRGQWFGRLTKLEDNVRQTIDIQFSRASEGVLHGLLSVQTTP